MDLSKAYDCIPHELLIVKLKCYGIENGSRLLLDYPTNQNHIMKIGLETCWIGLKLIL